MGGMWLFSLVLVLPLLIGVASSSKRIYAFLTGRGMSRNNALTVSVVGLIMLAGVMSSPMFLGALPVRLIAGAAYLYFLFVGGKTIVEFFTGSSSSGANSDGISEPAAPGRPESDHDCGCDHGAGDEGKHKPAGDADQSHGPKHPAPPARTPRSAAEARAEIERRIAESEGDGEGDKK